MRCLQQRAQAEENGDERVVTTICRANCFQACLLHAHVRDGKVVKMSRADYPEDIYSGCCLRGLSLHERTYSSNRLKYPLKRVEGTERGAGEWGAHLMGCGNQRDCRENAGYPKQVRPAGNDVQLRVRQLRRSARRRHRQIDVRRGRKHARAHVRQDYRMGHQPCYRR